MRRFGVPNFDITLRTIHSILSKRSEHGLAMPNSWVVRDCVSRAPEISNRVARRESIILSYSVLKAPTQPDRKFRAGRLKLLQPRRSGISFSAVQGYETVRSASASPEEHPALYAAWPRIHRLAVKSIETGAKFGRNPF